MRVLLDQLIYIECLWGLFPESGAEVYQFCFRLTILIERNCSVKDLHHE